MIYFKKEYGLLTLYRSEISFDDLNPCMFLLPEEVMNFEELPDRGKCYPLFKVTKSQTGETAYESDRTISNRKKYLNVHSYYLDNIEVYIKEEK